MKRKLLSAAALLALACPALAADPSAPQWGPERNIRTGDIEVYTKVSGIATAQDTYDIFAPFDGRVEELQAELFDSAEKHRRMTAFLERRHRKASS